MKESVKKGFGFGLTSGVITTLGMMVGLNASTGSRTAVIGGIIAIAIADAFSDAVGMHILVFQLSMAILVSVCWGVSLVIIFSWHLANLKGSKIYRVVLEHVAIVGLVIFITHYVGGWIATIY